MACNPENQSTDEFRIGREVQFSTREGIYVFEKRKLWDRLKEWLKNSFRLG
jgi:hypothetical protein